MSRYQASFFQGLFNFWAVVDTVDMSLVQIFTGDAQDAYESASIEAMFLNHQMPDVGCEFDTKI